MAERYNAALRSKMLEQYDSSNLLLMGKKPTQKCDWPAHQKNRTTNLCNFMGTIKAKCCFYIALGKAKYHAQVCKKGWRNLRHVLGTLGGVQLFFPSCEKLDSIKRESAGQAICPREKGQHACVCVCVFKIYLYLNKCMQLFVVASCHYCTIHPQPLKSTFNYVDSLGTHFHPEIFLIHMVQKCIASAYCDRFIFFSSVRMCGGLRHQHLCFLITPLSL